MKTTISNLRKLFRNLAEAGHVDRSRRQAQGYDEADIDVDYLDRANEAVDIAEDPGVSQSKRMKHGYGLEEPADYDTSGEGLPQKDENSEEIPMAIRVRLHPKIPNDAPQMGPPMKLANFVDMALSGEPDLGDDMEEECMPSLKKMLNKK